MAVTAADTTTNTTTTTTSLTREPSSGGYFPNHFTGGKALLVKGSSLNVPRRWDQWGVIRIRARFGGEIWLV